MANSVSIRSTTAGTTPWRGTGSAWGLRARSACLAGRPDAPAGIGSPACRSPGDGLGPGELLGDGLGLQGGRVPADGVGRGEPVAKDLHEGDEVVLLLVCQPEVADIARGP